MNDEIRKLLGGYATNSLTHSQQKALFEAALEDQELFNALQDEQALKELLSDPVSRAQIQSALILPRVKRPVWRRLWVWSSAFAAVAAGAIVTTVVMRQPAPVDLQSTAALREPEAPATVSAPPQEFPKKTPLPRQGTRFSAPAAAPTSNLAESAEKDVKESAPPPPQDAQLPAARAPDLVVTQAEPQIAPLPPAAQTRAARPAILAPAAPGGAVAGAAAKVSTSPLRFTLLRREADGSETALPSSDQLKAGDAFRITVSPAVPGNLAIYEVDRSGDATRVYPAGQAVLQVTANSSHTLPETPLLVKDSDARIRIVLTPDYSRNAASELVRDDNRPRAQKLSKAAAAPLIVDIPVGSKQVSK